MKKVVLGFLVTSLLVVSLLVVPPLAGTVQGSTAYPCSVPSGVTVSFNGVLDDGEWNSTCRFDRELRGVPENVSDTSPQGWHWEYPPFNQSMTLHIMRDGGYRYFAWNWTHHWDNSSDDPSPDNFGLGAGFDFDHDRVWEDNDNNVHTIDDALVLIYLGYTINTTGWVNIYIPKGLYPFSWNATANEGQGQLEEIKHDPGPLDPEGNPFTFEDIYGADRTPDTNNTDTDYAYTIEVAVPNALFQSPAGFGYGLSQGGYTWSWPTEWTGYYADDKNPYYPIYFGTLTESGPGPYSLFEFGDDVFRVPSGTAWYVLGDYVLHSRTGYQFRDAAPKGSPLVSAIATDIFAAQYFYGGSYFPQNVILDTDSRYISQGSGDFGNATGISGTIVAVGGPAVNQVVHYYMFNSNETQLFFDSGAIKRRDTGANVTSEGSSWTSDVFVVESFVDSEGRIVYMFWGKVYLGTMAATCFMMEVLMKPSNPYGDTSWFVVRWNEATSGPSVNGMPDAGDTFTVIANGPAL